MSRENVEIVRRVYEANARRDAEAVLALYDPAIEFDFTRPAAAAVIGARVYHGYEGLRSFDREWHEAFENVETDCEELIDAGDHQVISIAKYRARGRASGIEVAGTAHAGVWTLRDGKVVRSVWFDTREEALEAVGMRE